MATYIVTYPDPDPHPDPGITCVYLPHIPLQYQSFLKPTNTLRCKNVFSCGRRTGQ
ncbi:hypothetical protein P280DRAFT_469352 [Massarina eburnea CBS 473.64]|uniref:Uncharacterized protein n=1 Tax=Massarina eburnea CBS 473.64 TaxID=1395130 RepID=A0A6A6RYL0_9PLEO|nr:hypothetical protein P280DRAFT_469352 [Massarina eburnea CBS 473.64]